MAEHQIAQCSLAACAGRKPQIACSVPEQRADLRMTASCLTNFPGFSRFLWGLTYISNIFPQLGLNKTATKQYTLAAHLAPTPDLLH